MSNSPNTLAVAQAIVAYAQSLTFGTPTGGYKLVALGEIKDIIDQVIGGNVCLEIYGNRDNSQHKGFGGKIMDEQTWFLLSMASLDNAQTAEQLLYAARDALVQPIQTHATLGNAGSVYHAQVLDKSGKFLKIFRNGQWMRAHVIEVMTRQEWFVVTPPGVIA